jgi:hypothetical protein
MYRPTLRASIRVLEQAGVFPRKGVVMINYRSKLSGMKMKNKKGSEKRAVDDSSTEKLAKYAKAPYFAKKDKKAAEFLQKHPVPAKFLR